MALNLYRRHGANCTGGRVLHDMTYEADELRRTWKKCYCPVYASGTLAGRFKRKTPNELGGRSKGGCQRVGEGDATHTPSIAIVIVFDSASLLPIVFAPLN